MIGQGCRMTSIKKNFNMKIIMEAGTRMMMRTLLFSASQRRESLPLKTARRKTREKSSVLQVTSLDIMQVNH
jgi:hypothetical protein